MIYVETNITVTGGVLIKITRKKKKMVYSVLNAGGLSFRIQINSRKIKALRILVEIKFFGLNTAKIVGTDFIL